MKQEWSKIQKRVILIILFFLLACLTVTSLSKIAEAQLIINELMYNPSDCHDTECEWIELYNTANNTIISNPELQSNSSIRFNHTNNSDLKDCFLDTKKLPSFSLSPQSYLIITRNKNTFLKHYPLIQENGSNQTNSPVIIESIFSLSNTGDTISIHGAHWCNDIFDYSPIITFANGNNMTLERKENGTWRESLSYGGTPGKKNTLLQPLAETISNKTNQSVPSNQSKNTTTQSCSIDLSIELAEMVTESKNVFFAVSAKTTTQHERNYSVKGTITTVQGAVIKEYFPWTNESFTLAKQKTKAYSPNLQPGTYVISFNETSSGCQLRYASHKELLIVVSPKMPEQNSSLEIEKVYLSEEGTVGWGEQFLIKVKVYKGEDTKYSVKIYLMNDKEKISQTTSINLFNQFQEYQMTIPLQVDLNCNQKKQANAITLVMEGLGERAEKSLHMKEGQNNLCQTTTTVNSSDVSHSESLTPNTSKSNISKKEFFSIQNMSQNISVGQNISFILQIQTDDSPHSYRVYSYLYSGAHCYSCKQGELLRNSSEFKIEIPANQFLKQNITIYPDAVLPAGKNYKIKTKIFKDGRKTPKEITQNITFLITNTSSSDLKELQQEVYSLNTSLHNSSKVSYSNNSISSISLNAKQTIDSENVSFKSNNKITGAIAASTIYTSTNEKSTIFIPILLMVVVCSLLIILWRKP